jgi:hypothetical protein
VLGNKRAWEVHGGLVVLLEHWDGGERGQRVPAPGGGGNGGGSSVGAWRRDKRAFICCSA